MSEVTAIIDGGSAQITAYRYDANGNRAGMTHPNGTVVDYQYDVRNRLQTLVHRAGSGVGAALLLGLSYQVDASGLRTQISETRQDGISRITDYHYDAVKRLIAEQVSGDLGQARSTSWTYDAVGNRLSETSSGTVNRNQGYQYDANDRLLEETGSEPAQYSYDPAGNLIEKRNGATVLATYQWDSEDRLRSATIGSTLTSYAYDPNGIRRASEVNDGSTHRRTEYLVDPNQAYAQVLEEWGAETTPGQMFGAMQAQALYLHGDDLISQTRLHAGLSETHVYHYDGLGTTRVLSDASGVVTDRYAYTAFGTADPAGTSGNNGQVTENPYQYTGEQLDEELGWYYLRARYMDPGVGRFVGMDRWMGNSSDPVTLHKYLYGNADPVGHLDPSGMFSLTEVSTVVNIIGIGATSINAGFRIAEGDYRGAAEGVVRDAVFWAIGAGVGRLVAPLSKSMMGLFSRAFMVPLEMGLARSGSVLTRNMEAVMAKVGMKKPAGWQAHHIVGEAYPEGKAAMDILTKKFKIDVNSPHNGVFLPGCGATGSTGIAGLAVHCGKHVQKYEQYVLAELQAAKSEVDAINILGRIRDELTHSNLFLNARGNL